MDFEDQADPITRLRNRVSAYQYHIDMCEARGANDEWMEIRYQKLEDLEQELKELEAAHSR